MVFSIIVPVYNAEKYLKRCLDSLIYQTFQNIEIILIDDGSSDQSFHICSDYQKIDRRIKLIHQENQGVAVARNVGIESARGDWFLFVDADDYLNRNTCETVYRNLNKKVDLILFNYKRFTEYQYEEENSEVIKSSIYIDLDCYSNLNHKDFIEAAIGYKKINIKTCLNSPWAKAYKKEMIKNNQIRFEEGLKIGEDLIFNLYVYQSSEQILYLDFCGYHYYENPNSTLKRFRTDFHEIDLKYKKAFQRFIIENQLGNTYEEANGYSILNGMANSLSCFYFHPEQNCSYQLIRKQLKKLIKTEPYQSAYFKYFNIIKFQFSRSRRILIQLLFSKKVRCIALLFKLKNMDFKLRK